jgi:two-component system phosphate regulon sensor histidine kinase PhoR
MSLAIFLLLLVTAAFVLYHKSYRMQMQMALFKESLFSNVTHEIKTPLSSLQLIINSFKEQELSPKQKEYIDFASTELERMNLLVEKILSFGKLNKEQFAVNKEILNVGGLIQKAVRIMNITADSKNAQITFVLQENCDLAGDEILLLNMLVSIIDNALKYAGDQPIIHIAVVSQKDAVKILITDNGPGIGAKYWQKIFEPFFRIPTGNEHTIKGHGLGLSFARQVAILHKGKISVESLPRQGSTFIITLPS